MRCHFVLAACLLTSVFTSTASAQQLSNIALDQLQPTPAGDAFVAVPSPFIGGHLVPSVCALFDHASDPLVLSTPSTSATVVGHQTLLHLDASLALWDRLLVDLLLPLVLTQGGDNPTVQQALLSSPSSAALGDLRFGARIRVLGSEDDPFQLSGGVNLHFPSGTQNAFSSDAAFGESPFISFGGKTRFFVYSASIGAAIRTSNSPATLTYGAAAALLIQDGFVQIGPEFFAATPLQGAALMLNETRTIPRERLTNAEALLAARVRLPAGLSLGVGGGLGFGQAIGTPAFRLLALASWTLPTSNNQPLDTDEDGIADATDACPFAFGPTNADIKQNGCPTASEPDEPTSAPPTAKPNP